MTPPTTIRTYRKDFGDGRPSRVTEIRTTSLEPLLLSAPGPVRAREAADIFAAKVQAPVVAVSLPPQVVGAGLAPVALRRFENETPLTLRAVLGRLIAEGGLPVERARGSPAPELIELGHRDPKVARYLQALRAKDMIAVAARLGKHGAPPMVLPVAALGHLRSARWACW